MTPITSSKIGEVKGLEFHHIGVACRALDEEEAQFLPLGYASCGPDFEDPQQRVRGRFLTGPGPTLELLAPLKGPSPVDPWLEKGVKFYHLAYMTEDLEGALRELRSRRAKTVVAPVPAVAFGGRRISFVLLPGMAMVELIEAPRDREQKGDRK